MSRIDSFLDRQIAAKLERANAEERASHRSSRKLSASRLGWPLQWQVLKLLGIPPKPFDEFSLRKFLRGKQIEDWLVSHLPDDPNRQKFVERAQCVGYVDAIVDTAEWDFPVGVIPAEVKSVSNAKYRRIVQQKGADRSHRLQATHYAMCLGSEDYAVIYVAADDLRVHTLLYKTADTAAEVEGIIARCYEWVSRGEVPVFEPNEEWQAKKEYNNYPEWADLGPLDIQKKLSRLKVVREEATPNQAAA